jgi:glucose/arabinose dehydrogenase
MKTKYFLLFLLLACIGGSNVKAQYVLQDAYPTLTFNSITECQTAPDAANRLFVVSQKGIIYVLNMTTNPPTSKVFLDISDRVSASSSGSEVGLLGLAFHPSYTTNGYFFVDYTSSSSGSLKSYIARYQVSSNPDSALKSSELIFLTQAQPYSNHNGGKVLFGPDGYLYISFGDGGSGGDPQGNGQNRATLLGKILRIDVNTASGGNEYSIPPSNPYFGSTQYKQEIFAYGMRNPWKTSFDFTTGRFWCADVGQSAREEVDIIVSGGNYGWNVMEGNICYSPSSGCDTSGKIKPIMDYGRSDCSSITGGYVVRSSPQLPDLEGKYVFGDYGTRKIFSIAYDGTTATSTFLLTGSAAISSWGVDKSKNVYACTYGTSGKLMKLVDTRVGVEGLGNIVPDQFYLMQNYPNPFNPSTKITFALPQSGNVTLAVYDNSGKIVQTLVNNESMSSGTYTKDFNAVNLSSGVYYYKLVTNSFSETKKMLLVK